jgi:hypothetical protein
MIRCEGKKMTRGGRGVSSEIGSRMGIGKQDREAQGQKKEMERRRA